jgi:replicative DNA helicase
MANPERFLISAVLRTGNMAHVHSSGVETDWFHDYSQEWSWIDNYYRRHGRVPSKSLYKSKFGEALLAVDDVEYGVEELSKHHVEKSLVSIMLEANDSLQEGLDPAKVLGSMHRDIIKVQSQVDGSGSEKELNDDWQSIYRDIQNRAKRSQDNGMPGIPTGFETLDEITGGMEPGEFWVVAARLGQGKTWTLIRMACAALFGGYRVQYDAMEQSRLQIAIRVHAFLSSKYGEQVFRASDMQKGSVDLRKYRAYLKSMKDKLDGSLFINDASTGRVTPLTIASQIERNNPNVVFVDYLGLMGSGGSAQREQWQNMAQLSAELKGLAMRYQIPIVAASQINRMGVGGKAPGVEHLAGSDAIGHDADAVLTMRKESDHVMRLRLAKYRHGRDGVDWWTHFTPNTGGYEEITKERAEEIREQDIAAKEDY